MFHVNCTIDIGRGKGKKVKIFLHRVDVTGRYVIGTVSKIANI